MQSKARPIEIATQGYEEGSGSHNPPSLPVADPPLRYQKAPSPSARLFVLRSRRHRCAGVGCSPRRCFKHSPYRAARLGLPARCCSRSRATARRLARGLTAVTNPAWRGQGGPHCLLPQRGPATMSHTLNCCCETDGVSQAQGEAKVRGQGEQGGERQLPCPPSQPATGRRGLPGHPMSQQRQTQPPPCTAGKRTALPNPPSASRPETRLRAPCPRPRAGSSSQARQGMSGSKRRGSQPAACLADARATCHQPVAGLDPPARRSYENSLWSTPHHPGKHACP